ncbi:hypothetical protein [Candidatus Marinarcus aquaticus]|uniref:hypothetical protein n=1 Tax=Candidatus Marinarcus aquaticus TaxID=2044504 RepID=UPI001D1703E4|nr:hypothetical protein [Candidatus Marinarcus aquaticus]
MVNYRKNSQNLGKDLAKDGNLILKIKQRYVLYEIIKKLNLNETYILLPTYTCHSLLEVIKETKNKPLFYSVKDFTVDGNEIHKYIKKYNISIMIVSDVFGIKVAVPSGLYSEDIIFIGDFAHHINFIHKDDERKFDVAMYSSSFYKPMISNGIGIGIVLNQKKVNIDSVSILKNNFFSVLGSFSRLFLIQLLLNSNFLKFFINDKKENSSIIFDVKECKKIPSVYDFSLLFNYKLNERKILNHLSRKRQRMTEKYKNLSFLRLYAEEEKSTYFNVLVKNKKRFQAYLLNKKIFTGSVFTDYAGKEYVENTDAKQLSDAVINLPFINEHDEEYIYNVIRKYKNV